MLEDFGGCWRCFFLCVPVPSSCARACSVSRFGHELYIYNIFVIVLKAKLVQMPRADLGSIPILMPMLGAHAMPVSTPNGLISVGVQCLGSAVRPRWFGSPRWQKGRRVKSPVVIGMETQRWWPEMPEIEDRLSAKAGFLNRDNGCLLFGEGMLVLII
jgi:hypothetical protein